MAYFPLSNELVDLVVDHIGRKCDLWACTLVSKAFYRASARHLYRHIDIIVRKEAAYSESYCKTLSELFTTKLYILNLVRSLRVSLDSDIAWKLTFNLRKRDLPKDVKRPGNHHELTKFLLLMTRATRLVRFQLLERLVVSQTYGRPGKYGSYVFLALIAIRCMPSLRVISFRDLDNPHPALVFGIPGMDQVEKLDIDLQLDAENHWKKLGDMPKKGPLVKHFDDAHVNWNDIFRLYRAGDTSTIDPSSAPLQQLTHLRSTRLPAFLVHVREARHTIGGASIQDDVEAPRFPRLQSLNYNVGQLYLDEFSFETGGIWPHFRQLGEVLLFDCPQVERLVITFSPETSFPEWDQYTTDALIPPTSAPRLRELVFRLEKTLPFDKDSLIWVGIASLYLRSLGPQHRLGKVIINWPTMWQPNEGIGIMQDDQKLLDLEALLDIVPALSLATMVMTCDVHGTDDIEYVKRIREVWKHPRSSVICKMATVLCII